MDDQKQTNDQPPTIPSPPKSNMDSIKRRNNPTLQEKIEQLRFPILPIYQLPCNDPHPKYPKSLLEFWLLSEDDCDSIARYYHQLSPTSQWHNLYPSNMNWDCDFLAKPDPQTMDEEDMQACLNEEDRVWLKKRMVGKFIGFPWCRTPIAEVRKRISCLEERIERKLRKERRLRKLAARKEFRGDRRWA